MTSKTPKNPQENLTNWARPFKISKSREVLIGQSRRPAPDIASGIAEANRCPYCSTKSIIKKGTRKKKFEKVQLYFCKECQKTFTPQTIKGKHYPLKFILDALSFYNLGYNLEDASQLVQEQYGLPVKPSTIANWVGQFSSLCKYSRMRKFGKKLFSAQQIAPGISLYHRQIYKFRIHRIIHQLHQLQLQKIQKEDLKY